MPNPLSKVRAEAAKNMQMGGDALLDAPELANWIIRILGWWPFVETQLGFSLANLLKTEAVTGAAIFGSLRSTPAQGDILTAAAEVVLEGDPDLPLFRTLLAITRSVGRQRNTIAHGLWGYSKKVPKALLCVDPQMYHRVRGHAVQQVRSSTPPITYPDVNPDPRHVWVYRARDFELLYDTMVWLIGALGDFWWMRDMPPHEHDLRRIELSNAPRVREAVLPSQKAGKNAQKALPPNDPPTPTQE